MIIDLSRPIYCGMPVYPGDDDVSVKEIKTLERDCYNAYLLCTGLHAGTHVDAPMHLTKKSGFIGDIPPEQFIGRGVLARYDMPLPPLEPGDAVLFETGADALYGSTDYYDGHAQMPLSICDALIKAGVRLIGLDAPSPDRPPFPAHKRLLEAGVCVAENLWGLNRLQGLRFTFQALPLRIRAEASLVRAIAIV